MKKQYKFAVLFSAIVVSTVILSACNQTSDDNKKTSTIPEISTQTSTAQIEESKSGNDNSPENSAEEVVSAPESSIEEESTPQVSEISETSEQPENSTEEESSQETSVEESSTYNAYYFDDEQIVDDYHTATEFTSNEEFNKLFSENPIDKEYQSELQNVNTIVEMRNVTSNYAMKWKNEVSGVYDTLYGLLDNNKEARTALENSQAEWNKGLEDIENTFYEEASRDGAGSDALLSADTAVMNYYKGRAAILYEQIYELTGKFEM